ncbi:TPA: hypothetical protein MYQ36_003755 [Citrobacter braakii]|nr:hypothetical protein [Citrobacter braakii]MBA7756992.1 hypothetical protein [Citrobacter sp. RHBSTW-00325]MBA8060003.1 hypothetical protein [Citrobacter sp. RHBSTW-00104]MBU5685996.1 hypothetical protein [Citrobacter sp. S44_ASV_140]QLR60592.1 hypothetical protein HV341_21115 [Citrobacter sp. RHBSTW-00976]QLS32550.1 hypothetical protein HV320_22685 [Citrobacter sp. RHBSTW-00903]QLS63061.1 hypothetical protein HV311_21790 [Citrobacter sp. RHBSTW-00881]QLV33735.1 hypothetical protein HV191_
MSDLRCVVPASVKDGGHYAFGDDVCFRQGTQVQVSHVRSLPIMGLL